MPELTKNLSLFEEVPQLNKQIPIEETLISDEITAYKQPSDEKATAIEKEAIWSLSEIMTVIYFLGLSVFAGIFLYRLSRLFLLIRRRRKTRYAVFTIVQLSGRQVFSFFHYVFVDASRYGEKELKALLSHEQVHIQQWHSMDVLMLEILQVIFWFNPLYRFYRKLLQKEHEYFVDAATSKEIGQPQYAQMLLNLATTKQPVLGHAFAYIPIKNRIFKLFQKPSTTMERSRFFIALPIVLSLFLVFSCSFDELQEDAIKIAKNDGKVSTVSAYFKDGQAAFKSEKLFLEVRFDENGAIIKKPIPEQVFSMKSLTNYAFYFIDRRFAINPFESYSNHIEGLPNNFYPKNIQHLIVRDPVFKNVEMLLHYNNMDKYIDLDIASNLKEADYNTFNMQETGDYVSSYTLEREEEFGRSSINVDVAYDTYLPIYWKKSREYVPFSTEKIPPVNFKNMSREEAKKHLEKHFANTPSSMGYSFEMAYNAEDLLSKIIYFPRTLPNGNETEMRLYYNGAQQIHEMEMYNAEGIFLRKYRFHYNEAGYCTKKECINREGDVEFSVRFEYDFFD